MEIILREQVEKLGDRGDIVKVKAGYARNFLLPQRKAILVTPHNVRQVEQEKVALVRREAIEKKESELLAQQLSELILERARTRRSEEKDANQQLASEEQAKTATVETFLRPALLLGHVAEALVEAGELVLGVTCWGAGGASAVGAGGADRVLLAQPPQDVYTHQGPEKSLAAGGAGLTDL